MNVFLFLLFYCLHLGLCDDKYLDPEWKDPHAWADQRSPKCPQLTECRREENEIRDCLYTDIAYKKLLTFFFDEEHFKETDTDGYLHRTINIHITVEQLKKFAKLTKTQELDGLVSEVLAQSKFGTLQAVREFTFDLLYSLQRRLTFNFDYDWPHIQKEVPWLTLDNVFKTIALLAAFYACRRLHVSFALVLIGAAAYFLYMHLDFECRKKLAVEESLDFMYNNGKNPCASSSSTWWEWITGTDDRTKCREHLMKLHSKPNQCDIISLYREFIDVFILEQMEMFFKRLASMIQSISVTYGLIITVITLYFMKGLLTTGLYSTFKYILNPSVWFNARRAHLSGADNQQQTISNGSPSILDSHLTKTLDLAHAQARIMEKMITPNAKPQTSGVEMVAAEVTTVNSVAVAPASANQLAANQTATLAAAKTIFSGDTATTVMAIKTIGISDVVEDSRRENDPAQLLDTSNSSSSQISDIETLIEPSITDIEET